jgi:DNA-binding beta-propeller fold protein YncE
MSTRRFDVALAIFVLAFPHVVRPAETTLPLQFVSDIPLPGRATRFDYESIDSTTRRLYLAHLGDSAVTVIDMVGRSVIGNVENVGHAHGVLVIPTLGRIYASATLTNEVVAIDEKTLEIVARIPGGIYPDGMAYVADLHRLYVSDEAGKTESVIDTTTEQLIATISLQSVAGNSQYDLRSKHIFIAAQSLNQLIEIDPLTNAVIARYALHEADRPHGLLIDPTSNLAFVACEGNDRLVVFDLQSMRPTDSFPVGGDPDVIAYDAGVNRLYVAGEQGVVSVFTVIGRSVEKLGEAFLGPNAHVVGIDPQTHLVYFPLKDLGGRPVLRVMAPTLGTSH